MTDLDKEFPGNGAEPERPEVRPPAFYPALPSSGPPSTGGVPLAAPPAPITSPAPPGQAPPPARSAPPAPAPPPAQAPPPPASAPPPAPVAPPASTADAETRTPPHGVPRVPSPPPGPSAAAPPMAAATPAAVVKGRITIEDKVIEKIATMAALEVEGVAASSARAAGPASGQFVTPGHQHDNEVSLDLRLAVEYGCAVMDVAKEVKRNVARMVSVMLGLRVAAVDITIEDVRVPARD